MYLDGDLLNRFNRFVRFNRLWCNVDNLPKAVIRNGTRWDSSCCRGTQIPLEFKTFVIKFLNLTPNIIILTKPEVVWLLKPIGLKSLLFNPFSVIIKYKLYWPYFYSLSQEKGTKERLCSNIRYVLILISFSRSAKWKCSYFDQLLNMFLMLK